MNTYTSSDIEYYQTLFLTPYEDNQEEIKSSYYSLIKIFHPDKNGISEVSQKINKAYKVLSDPLLKVIYDQLGKDGLMPNILSEKLIMKASKIFKSSSISQRNREQVEAYKDYLIKQLKWKIEMNRDRFNEQNDPSQIAIVHYPQLNYTTSMTFQHQLIKNIIIGTTFPRDKQHSYFLQANYSNNSFNITNLFLTPQFNTFNLQNTIGYKRLFCSSTISHVKGQWKFKGNSIGIQLSPVTLSYVVKEGLRVEGIHMLSENSQLKYHLSLPKGSMSIQKTANTKKVISSMGMSFNNTGLSLSHSIYNKKNSIEFSSGLSIGHKSITEVSLSIGLRTTNFAFSIPLFLQDDFNWYTTFLVILPFFYGKYLMMKGWKKIYSVYDKINCNNHLAYIEQHRSFLLEQQCNKDYKPKVVIMIGLVGHKDSIKKFITNRKEDDVFDITIALSIKSKGEQLIIENDIFDIEGIFAPKYKQRENMWYYISYQVFNDNNMPIEKIVFVKNHTQEVLIS